MTSLRTTLSCSLPVQRRLLGATRSMTSIADRPEDPPPAAIDSRLQAWALMGKRFGISVGSTLLAGTLIRSLQGIMKSRDDEVVYQSILPILGELWLSSFGGIITSGTQKSSLLEYHIARSREAVVPFTCIQTGYSRHVRDRVQLGCCYHAISRQRD
jgi:hypothetical protein